MATQDSVETTPGFGNSAESVSAAPRGRVFRLEAVFTRTSLWVALFTIVGLLVRLYRLDARGFWFDEVTFAWPVRLNSPGEVLRLTGEFGDQSPLSFFLTWLLRGLGGSEWAIRLPFALAGTLCVPAIYLLGRELARPRVGLVSALLFALSPFVVFHSQDAHPYTPLLLFTILQLLFAWRAVAYGQWYDWLGFVLCSILNLYNDFLGVAVLGVACLFIGLALAGRIILSIRRNGASGDSEGEAGSPGWRRRVMLQSSFAIASFIIIFLAYLPWLPSFLNFLGSPIFGVNRLAPGTQGSLADLGTLTYDLGFNLFVAALLLCGFIYLLVTLVRDRKLQSLLLFIWVALPLAALWVRAGTGILLFKAQYFAFLYPAAIILIALAIEWLAHLPANSKLKTQSSKLRAAFYGVLLAAVLLQTSVALAESYSWPQITPQDYRGAADKIIAESPPGSMVVDLGMWGIKPAPNNIDIVDGIDYYLWLRHSPIKVVDGSLLDQYKATHIADPDAVVWGAVTLPWPLTPEQEKRAADLGLEITQLQNVELLRQRAPVGSPAEQIDTLLNWGSALQPGLVATRAMLNPSFRAETLGDNILPAAGAVQVPARPGDVLNGEEQQDKWVLWSGVSLSQDASSFVLSPDSAHPQVNLTLSTRKLVPGKTYVLTFHYRNSDLQGEQHVYVSAYSDNGSLVDTLPYGAGFLCQPDSGSESAFAFVMPPTATKVILWLRTEGNGTAQFSAMQLQPLK